MVLSGTGEFDTRFSSVISIDILRLHTVYAIRHSCLREKYQFLTFWALYLDISITTTKQRMYYEHQTLLSNGTTGTVNMHGC